MTAYLEQLDDSNLAIEAFGGMSKYPKVRQAVFFRLALAWNNKDYKHSAGWQTLNELVQAGKRPLFAGLLFDFLAMT